MKTRYYAAAGGIVVRDGRALALHKHAKDEYMLPKGHIEPGETREEAALRETREETGYLHLRVLADLGTGRAEFVFKGEHVVRDEAYFLMALVDDARDENPEHEAAAYDRDMFRQLWVPVEALADQLTFEPAKAFARRAAAWLADQAPWPPSPKGKGVPSQGAA
jgi:8-oxo-dGTP pyrophosphatase MutT (NUDIX family)